MRKRLIFTLLAFMAARGLFPDDLSSVLSETEKAWLDRHKEIVFVSQTRYPPFEFKDAENQSDGMTIELVRWIATEFGFKARFRDMSFNKAQEAVRTGNADVLTSLFYSKIRDESFDFTSRTWEVPALIFVQSDRPDIRGLRDLKGKKVAMQRGDYAEEFLGEKGIPYTLVPTDSFGQAVDMVLEGKADALIGDKQIVLYYLYSNKLENKIKSEGDPLYVGQNCMAVREGRTILRSILDKGLQKARESGIYEKINNKWMGTNYALKENWLEKFFLIFIIVFAVFLAVIVFSLLWNLQLRRQVSRRTEQLRSNELRLKSIFNAIPDLLWLKDPQGSYQNCNPRYERLMGVREGVMNGKTDYDFFRENTADEFTYYDRKAAEDGSSIFETEVEYSDDGHRENVEILKTALYDEAGNLEGILGIARDITERVKSETFLNAILESIPNMVFVKEAKQLKFVRFNRAAELLLGYNKSDMIGKSDHDFFPREEADFFTSKDREVLEKNGITDIPEETIRTSSGETRILHTRKIPICDSEGNPIYLLGISDDITEQKQIVKQLQIQRDLGVALGAVANMKKALELCLDALLNIPGIDCGEIYLVDRDEGSLTLSGHRNLPEDFVREISRLGSESPHFRIINEGKPLYTTNLEIMVGLDLDEKALRLRRKAGLRGMAFIPISQNGVPVAAIIAASKNEDRFKAFTISSLEAISSQISESLSRIFSDTALINSQQNFQTLFDNITDFLFIISDKGRLIHWNPTVEKRLGYRGEELTKLPFSELLPPERRKEAERIVGEMIDGWRSTSSIPLLTIDGQTIPVETHVTKGSWNGQEAYFGISRDISEMKKSEAQIRKALQEKEILLKEIHHRVKNNLQVVSSLLSLQSETTDDPVALEAFAEAETRVRSMSLVHEILYKSDNLEMISISTYLDNLVENLRDMYIERNVSIEVESGDVNIELEQAITCGLIFTELVSNSLKHAFAGPDSGKIRISVEGLADGKVRAVIGDNGCGLPVGFNPLDLKSLGMRLVTDLITDQLEGTWNLDGSDGTVWSFEWKAN